MVTDVSMGHSANIFRVKLPQEEIICKNLKKKLQNICNYFPIETASYTQKAPVFINATFKNFKSLSSEVCNKKYCFLRTVCNCGCFRVQLAVSENHHDHSTVL